MRRSFGKYICYSARFSPLEGRRVVFSSCSPLPFLASCALFHCCFGSSFPSSFTMPKKKNSPKEQRMRSGKHHSSGETRTISSSTEILTSKFSATTIDGGTTVDRNEDLSASPVVKGKLSHMFTGKLSDRFTADDSVYARAQIRATFYPKFENEKSDQEVRLKMIELVSNGLATLEVTLKHSGSLFMYAGSKGGAYAKNSFGNIYTAVGVFVLGRMFKEAWVDVAEKKKREFNDFLEENRMSVSMELVTAVLGDHGQRPKVDYAVVTALTELGKGKPKFYSTPEIIAFCRKWRLPTNHVWLFSNRKSVTSFFAAYDALCEEGTATTVCRALDEIADLSVPGSVDHIEVQGEILEGLVARTVIPESLKHMDDVLKEYSPFSIDGAVDSGPTLREICAANKSNEMLQIKGLLQSVGPAFCPDHGDWLKTESSQSHSRSDDKAVIATFLRAKPADSSTSKLQEMIRVLRERRFPAAFKCYHNLQKIDAQTNESLFYRMVIHVYNDSVFRRYQREMRLNPGLWPLYRGFFVDLDLIKTGKEKLPESGRANHIREPLNGSNSLSVDLADDNSNLMIKLKFLVYKLRTFLIRNGLSTLFKDGPAAYKEFYSRQMRSWGTSLGKQKALEAMLDEWAVHVLRKCGKNRLSPSVYLSEAEPFLEQYASRSPQNQALVGSAGSSVKSEDFLAIIPDHEENDDFAVKHGDSKRSSDFVKEAVQKVEGILIFFPGIPGCAKSALCKELVNSHEMFGEKREIVSLMGDLVKGKYWQKVDTEHRKKPRSIFLADKNAPNEGVWKQIEVMCKRNNVSAVPVVPDSEGNDSNPFSLDALAVFVHRVLKRANHPDNLDKESPNVGYVLLMFYNLYDGKSRDDFDAELIERFGFLVKMPLLKSERDPLPEPLRSVLEEGLSLFKLHSKRHGRLDSTKGTYAKEWSKWEQKLRSIVSSHSDYLSSIQVPFDHAVKHVLQHLKTISSGEYVTPIADKRKFGSIVYAAVDLPTSEILILLDNLAKENCDVEALMSKDVTDKLRSSHVTLAHKRSHGVAAVANYGHLLHQIVPVSLTALLFTEKMAALEAQLGCVEGEEIVPRNHWPHVTVWTAEGVTAKEANTLPLLHSHGKATRVTISPPVQISGPLQFY